MCLEYFSSSLSDTLLLAKKFTSILEVGDLVILDGDLGAGKTTFVKSFVTNLECDDLVTSPTFTITNIYECNKPIMHIDLYRLNIDEFIDLGIIEFFPQYIVFIEWGKKILPLLDEYIEITIKLGRNINDRIFIINSTYKTEKIRKIF